MSLKLGGTNPDQNSSLLSVIIVEKSHFSVYKKGRHPPPPKKKELNELLVRKTH